MSNPGEPPELDFGFNVPAGRDAFRTWEVARILRHSTKQIEALIELGQFGKCINCGAKNRKSYIVPRPGLIDFIKRKSH